MKKLIYTSVLLLLSICIFSCSPYKGVRTQFVNIGMSKNLVREKIGKKPKIIGKKDYKEGIVEVIEYKQYNMWSSELLELVDTYWFYFLNDKLIFWGHPSSSWIKEVDEYLMRNK